MKIRRIGEPLSNSEIEAGFITGRLSEQVVRLRTFINRVALQQADSTLVKMPLAQTDDIGIAAVIKLTALTRPPMPRQSLAFARAFAMLTRIDPVSDAKAVGAMAQRRLMQTGLWDDLVIDADKTLQAILLQSVPDMFRLRQLALEGNYSHMVDLTTLKMLGALNVYDAEDAAEQKTFMINVNAMMEVLDPALASESRINRAMCRQWADAIDSVNDVYAAARHAGLPLMNIMPITMMAAEIGDGIAQQQQVPGISPHMGALTGMLGGALKMIAGRMRDETFSGLMLDHKADSAAPVDEGAEEVAKVVDALASPPLSPRMMLTVLSAGLRQSSEPR